MSDAARSRLAAERKNLIESRPAGCYARPTKKADGSIDLMRWEAGITPLPSSLYALAESGTYRLILEFAADYPASPPKVSFSPPIFHTNVFGSGAVCLSLLLTEGHHPGAGHRGFWQATLTLGEVLKHMQVFLDEPNPNSIANAEACDLLKKKGEAAYNERVRRFAADYPKLLLQLKATEAKK